MNKKTRRFVGIAMVLLLQFAISFEMNVVLPLAPNIARFYNIAPHQVTYLNIGYSLFGLTAPYFGYKSEKIGTKKTISLIGIIFFIGSLLIATTSSVIAYIVGRSFTGIALSTMMAIGLNYLSLLVEPRKLGVISGLFRTSQSIAIFFSPIIGTFIANKFSFQFIYSGLAIILLVIVPVFMVFAPNVLVEQSELKISSVREQLKNKKEKSILGMSFLMSLPPVLFFSFLSVHLNDLNQLPNTIATVYSIVAFGSILGSLFITMFSDRIGKIKLMIILTSILPLITVVFSFTETLLYVIAVLFGFFYDAASGLLFPVGSILIDKYKATFLTVMSFTVAIATLVSNIIGPTLYSIGGFPLILIVISIGVAFSSYMLRVIRNKTIDLEESYSQ